MYNSSGDITLIKVALLLLSSSNIHALLNQSQTSIMLPALSESLHTGFYILGPLMQ